MEFNTWVVYYFGNAYDDDGTRPDEYISILGIYNTAEEAGAWREKLRPVFSCEDIEITGLVPQDETILKWLVAARADLSDRYFRGVVNHPWIVCAGGVTEIWASAYLLTDYPNMFLFLRKENYGQTNERGRFRRAFVWAKTEKEAEDIGRDLFKVAKEEPDA